MTREQLLENILIALGDQVFYSPNDVLESLQDTYAEIAYYTKILHRTVKITLPGTDTYYKLPSIITDFFSLISIYDPSTSRFLTPVSRLHLCKTNDRWETSVGRPHQYCVISWDKVGFYPHPESEFSLVVNYFAKAPTLQASDVPQIYSGEEVILEEGTIADLLETSHEYGKATRYWLSYHDRLNKLADRARNLASRTRVFQ